VERAAKAMAKFQCPEGRIWFFNVKRMEPGDEAGVFSFNAPKGGYGFLTNIREAYLEIRIQFHCPEGRIWFFN